MATSLLPALLRVVLLFVVSFAAAALAFGTVMLISPPTSEAAVSTLTDDGVIEPITNCEFLPTGDVKGCTVYR